MAGGIETATAIHVVTDGSLIAQHAVVAVVVMAAALFVLRDRAPAFTRKLRIAIAVPLVREARPAWVKRVGQAIAPMPRAASACGRCNGCAKA